MEGQPFLSRATRPRTDPSSSQPLVSSRRRALQRLRAAVNQGQAGPVLITGEPGAGKTWLLRKMVESLPTGWRSANVDLASAMDAVEFLRLIGHSLGVTIPNRLGQARLSLQSTLQDESTDGTELAPDRRRSSSRFRGSLGRDSRHPESTWTQDRIRGTRRPGADGALANHGQSSFHTASPRVYRRIST